MLKVGNASLEQVQDSPCQGCGQSSATMYGVVIGLVKLVLCVACLSDLCDVCEEHTDSFGM